VSEHTDHLAWQFSMIAGRLHDNCDLYLGAARQHITDHRPDITPAMLDATAHRMAAVVLLTVAHEIDERIPRRTQAEIAVKLRVSERTVNADMAAMREALAPLRPDGAERRRWTCGGCGTIARTDGPRPAGWSLKDHMGHTTVARCGECQRAKLPD
jgi:hypothetical protein